MVVSACASGIPRYFLVALYWGRVGGGVAPGVPPGVPPPNGGSSALVAAPGALPPPAEADEGVTGGLVN